MRIHDNQLTGLTGAGVGNTERARGGEVSGQPGSHKSGQSQDGDRVQLSLLSDALRSASEDTPERLQRVEQLREAYQSGTYKEDAEGIGRRLIDEALGRGY